jgi:hypothetical protein
MIISKGLLRKGLWPARSNIPELLERLRKTTYNLGQDSQSPNLNSKGVARVVGVREVLRTYQDAT